MRIDKTSQDAPWCVEIVSPVGGYQKIIEGHQAVKKTGKACVEIAHGNRYREICGRLPPLQLNEQADSVDKVLT